MTQILPFSNPELTMSSREIAELTEKRHDHVMNDIRKMLTELGVHAPDFLGTYKTERGNEYECFNLHKRETLILVSGYSIAMRAKIIDRWQELEAKAAKPAPAELSRMDILKLAMESEQARIKAEAERDEAIRTKAQIGSKREATAMATAAKAKAEAAKAKAELGFCEHHATIKAVATVTGETYDWLPLRRWCKAHDIPPKKVVDPLYGKVQAWPAGAWWDCHRIDLRALFGGVETV